MTPIIYKLTDNVLIKGSNSSNSPQTVSVQTIGNYAIAQGYGNAFMLIDGGSSFSGSAIRFFTISGNTAYLGSTDFLSLNPYNTGISDGTSTNSNITGTTNVGYCYNGSSFNTISVAFNWGNYTKNNIKYYTQGGNTSANYGYQTGYYLPDTITNVYIDEEPVPTPSSSVTAPGGGATHIAKVTGHLSTLSNNLSDILIVAGGGGGGMIIDSVAYDGADAGGISGSGTNSANQTTGYAFGQGESGSGVSGGGGGLYGGYKGVSS